MPQDRRDYGRRAAATQSVVLDLLYRIGPVEGVAPDAVQRILRRLALRGLVRVGPTGWRPALPLLMPVALQPSNTDALR